MPLEVHSASQCDREKVFESKTFHRLKNNNRRGKLMVIYEKNLPHKLSLACTGKTLIMQKLKQFYVH